MEDQPPLDPEGFVMQVLQDCSASVDRDNMRPVETYRHHVYCSKTTPTPTKRRIVSFTPEDRWNNISSGKHPDKFPPSPISPKSSRWDSQWPVNANVCPAEALNKFLIEQSRPPLQPTRKRSKVELEDIFSGLTLLDTHGKISEPSPHSTSMAVPLALRTLPYS
jgi:hypothetical protein